MDGLESRAMKLTELANGKLAKVKGEYNKILEEIEQLNQLLQSKEMFVDRSENASFTVAVETRDRKQATANILSRRIDQMEVEGREYVPMGFIQLGSTVCTRVVKIKDNTNPDVRNPLFPKRKKSTNPAEQQRLDKEYEEKLKTSPLFNTNDVSLFYFKIVPEAYADSRDGLSSITSPFGRAAVGHVEGDIITAVTPTGNVQYKIEGVY